MKELACQFGERNHLVGVLTVPENVSSKRPAFLFISAGLLNKTGPYRLYVLMARGLAKLGFASLRFDLGGIGDSGSNPSHESKLHDRNIEDIQQAMSYLTKKISVETFVLNGLCSGAEDSFRAATVDERIKGLYLIDPHGYETARSRLRFQVFRMQRRFLKALGWYTKRKVEQVSGQESLTAVDFQYEMPQGEAKRKTEQLLSANTFIKYVYTGGVYSYYNYEDQFYDMYPGIDKTKLVEVELLDKMGHMPLLQEDKAALVDSISDWAKRNFSH